jgi:hypothetical protein
MKALKKDVNSLAINSLRKCYSKIGIYAGLHQFKDYWARDSFFASIGALKIGDLDIVKKNLSLFLRFEKQGRIPLRIGNKFFIQTMLGKEPKRLFTRFKEDKKDSFCSDSLTLFLITFVRFVKKSKDGDFARDNSPKIIRITKRLFSDTRENLLLKEGYYSTWMDAIKKKGVIFYSNLLYYSALNEVYQLYSKKGVELGYDGTFLTELFNKIQSEFWKTDHFTDWIGNNDLDYFDTFANLLAIYLGFASKSQSLKILGFIKEKKMVNRFGAIKKSFPDYSQNLISKRMRLLGLMDYCSNIYYPWMSFFYFYCVNRLGIKDSKIQATEESLLKRVLAQKEIFEAWDFKLKPYHSLFYYSEHPFAWACSFLVLLTNSH